VPSDNEVSSARESIRPLLLKVPEACAVLRVSRSQLYILLRNKEIEGITIGPGQRRIPYSECEAYVARKMTKQGAA
jgi:excisionase family DNA binding protein